MKQQIILAPGLNGNELTKNLALHDVNCFNLRIVSTGELARMSLMRSGITITEEFIDSNEQVALVAEAVKDVTYFSNPSFVDIRNIASAINRMRSLVSEQDEACVIKGNLIKGTFKEKNNALIEVYERYMQILKDQDAIDSVLLIRKAIAECSVIDAEFITLKEYEPNPLETALLQKVSGGKVGSPISINSLFNVEGKQKRCSC